VTRKLKITISVDELLMTWLDKQVEKKKLWSRSHGFNLALEKLKSENE